ncbi:hypothetical protein EPO04_02175 [Patescibacteria group bacterium]|nr:MAG: hypothetical protein EPO04_02175 [Patescibacteria group bacterium]
MTTATITLPPRKGEQPQHLAALERANEVRLARAELKRRIGTGETNVSRIVLSTPPEAAGMTVADLLMAQKRWGRTRTRKFLLGIPITETKTVGSLTERQRNAIAKALEAPTEASTTTPSREERIEAFAAQMQRSGEPGRTAS